MTMNDFIRGNPAAAEQTPCDPGEAEFFERARAFGCTNPRAMRTLATASEGWTFESLRAECPEFFTEFPNANAGQGAGQKFGTDQIDMNALLRKAAAEQRCFF
tara:strand:+ start:65 stop:373 length:309 start_codon:yes stop_codon:yes gene_type:complete